MWMSAGGNSLPRKVPPDLRSYITNLVEHMSSVLLCFLDVNHRGSRPRSCCGIVMSLKLRVLHRDLLLGVDVQFYQTIDLELVDVDAVGIRSEMEADGDELNDDLLDEIQDRANEDGDNDLVQGRFPVLGRFVPVDVMVLHGGEERYLDRKPPEEQRRRNFELFPQIPPLLAVVGEHARYHPHGPGDGFGAHLDGQSRSTSDTGNSPSRPTVSTK